MRISSPEAAPVPGHPAAGQPVKISVVFDEEASVGNAEVLIKHVASNFGCESQSYHFDELDHPVPGTAAARFASATDILVLALGDDRMLPVHMQYWLGLLAGLRAKSQRGALVVLFSQAVAASGGGSPLVEYLASVAALGGLDFIPQQRNVAPRPATGHSLLRPRPIRLPSPGFPAREYCPAAGGS